MAPTSIGTTPYSQAIKRLGTLSILITSIIPTTSKNPISITAYFTAVLLETMGDEFFGKYFQLSESICYKNMLEIMQARRIGARKKLRRRLNVYVILATMAPTITLSPSIISKAPTMPMGNSYCIAPDPREYVDITIAVYQKWQPDMYIRTKNLTNPSMIHNNRLLKTFQRRRRQAVGVIEKQRRIGRDRSMREK